jgi:hypothetical protein
MASAEQDDDWGRPSTPDRLARNHFLSSHHTYGQLIRAVAREAAKQPDELSREGAAEQGFEVVEALGAAVDPEWWEKQFRVDDNGSVPPKFKAWRHQSISLAHKKRLEPYIIRHDVEQAAAAYLALSYRVHELDRLIIDMLIAAELLAFADEIQPFLRRWLPLPLKWITNNVLSLVLGLGLGAAILAFGPDWALAKGIAWVIIVFTVLGTGWSLIAFPILYPSTRRSERKVRDVVSAMTDAYTTLGGSPTSVKHLEGRVLKAADLGAVWPAPLIVLLEDIQARRSSI